MQAVVVARVVFGAEVCVFWFIESGVFHELLFDFVFGVCFSLLHLLHLEHTGVCL
jgi:hypothetical protein